MPGRAAFWWVEDLSPKGPPLATMSTEGVSGRKWRRFKNQRGKCHRDLLVEKANTTEQADLTPCLGHCLGETTFEGVFQARHGSNHCTQINLLVPPNTPVN